MPILPIDSGRYGSEEIKKIFEEEQHLRYQLDFEAAVAAAEQAQIKMIGEEVHEDIIKRQNLAKSLLEKLNN